MVELGSGSKRKIENVKLSRYACYLIVQNADPSKEIVAVGQTYFDIQTRNQKILVNIGSTELIANLLSNFAVSVNMSIGNGLIVAKKSITKIIQNISCCDIICQRRMLYFFQAM